MTEPNCRSVYREYLGDFSDGDKAVAVDVVQAKGGAQFVFESASCRDVQRSQELSERDNSVAVSVVDAEDVATEALGVAVGKQFLIDGFELALTDVAFRKLVSELLEPLFDLGGREVGAGHQLVEVFRRQIRFAVGLTHLD